MVSLSRNFGKEAALLAGLDHARLGAVLFMDADGQHPPALIETWSATGSMTATTSSTPPRRTAQTSPSLRRLGVKAFYSLINWGARQKIPEDAGDFRLLSPRAAAALRQTAGAQPLLQGPRELDRLPPDPRRLRAGAARPWHAPAGACASLIGLSVEGLTSFSVAPLRLASLLGLLLAASALVFGVWMLIEAFVYGSTVPGYPSLIIGIMVIGGVQL